MSSGKQYFTEKILSNTLSMWISDGNADGAESKSNNTNTSEMYTDETSTGVSVPVKKTLLRKNTINTEAEQDNITDAKVNNHYDINTTLSKKVDEPITQNSAMSIIRAAVNMDDIHEDRASVKHVQDKNNDDPVKHNDTKDATKDAIVPTLIKKYVVQTLGNESCENRQYLVYRCQGHCGGLGDRQKGIISAYLLALLTNRTFVIDISDPCDIEHFMIPGGYDWLKCKNYALRFPASDSMTLRLIDHRIKQEQDLLKTDFDHAWSGKKVVYIHINWYAIDIVRQISITKHHTAMSWLANMTNIDVIHNVLKVLLRPVIKLRTQVEEFINSEVGSRKLVCSHIRIGNNPTLPLDVDFARRHGRPNVTALLTFLSKYNNARSVIYVATDAQYVRKSAAFMFDNFISFNKTIVHIDRYQNIQKSAACHGLYNALSEQMLLSKCDILILTRSGFGAMAAFMREKEGGLFAYNTQLNSIESLELENMFQMYNFA